MFGEAVLEPYNIPTNEEIRQVIDLDADDSGDIDDNANGNNDSDIDDNASSVGSSNDGGDNDSEIIEGDVGEAEKGPEENENGSEGPRIEKRRGRPGGDAGYLPTPRSGQHEERNDAHSKNIGGNRGRRASEVRHCGQHGGNTNGSRDDAEMEDIFESDANQGVYIGAATRRTIKPLPNRIRSDPSTAPPTGGVAALLSNSIFRCRRAMLFITIRRHQLSRSLRGLPLQI